VAAQLASTLTDSRRPDQPVMQARSPWRQWVLPRDPPLPRVRDTGTPLGCFALRFDDLCHVGRPRSARGIKRQSRYDAPPFAVDVRVDAWRSVGGVARRPHRGDRPLVADVG
jgi:hypothetical protein